MQITQEQIIAAGYRLPAAPDGAWRSFDPLHPVPNYYDFDWLSARHPDLYHAFALSTDGLAEGLEGLVDLSGLDVIDICAGTGRSASVAAATAKRVTAVDAYAAVTAYGKKMVSQAGFSNVPYIQGDCTRLPFAASSFDACINSWAILDYAEAYRVLRPGAYLIVLGPAPGAQCGELTPVLAPEYPDIITEVAPPERLDSRCPPETAYLPQEQWNGLPVIPPTTQRDFSYLTEYGDYQAATAIHGRLFGPKASRYLLDRQQSSVTWRMRVVIGRVRK